MPLTAAAAVAIVTEHVLSGGWVAEWCSSVCKPRFSHARSPCTRRHVTRCCGRWQWWSSGCAPFSDRLQL